MIEVLSLSSFEQLHFLELSIKNNYVKDLIDMARFSSDKLPTCPFVVTQKVLSGKWSILILHALEQGPKRFNVLHRELSGITQATLTKQLRQLEEDGIIIRKAYPQIPPKVEYQLSAIGMEFRLVLQQLGAWGNKYIHFLKTQ